MNQPTTQHKSKPQIEVQNLSLNFHLPHHQHTSILKNLTFQIQKGDFVSIIGPSGSGKSTLLHLLGCLIQPTHGHINIDGFNLHNLSENDQAQFRNKKIGFIFQDFHLLENLTVEENIALPLLIADSKKQLNTEENNYLHQLIKDLELSHRTDHKPSEISGGQKQRVAIGRALINHPEILLADEPTGNLDSQTGQQIIQLIQKIHQEKQLTLIIVTHDQKIADLADHIIQIKDGEITTHRKSTTYTH